ncbi:MAG: HipA domain-containing protein [Streptosporangiaceae bacterium]|nr:HipA domain-containing protein [Streptosporangiaceae bacterium]
MTHEAVAGVYLGARRVGTLGYREGSTWFDYEDVTPDHPVLGQAFEADPSRRRTASGRVPEWFANLLPEPGSGLRELVARDLDRRNVHDFLLLTYLGEDLPGAVRVVREGNGRDIPELAEADHCAHEHPLRFSLAGVQPKFSMRWDDKGLVLPVTGLGGDWIVKLPDRRFPQVPENEHAMLTWAALAGIEVPEHHLIAGADLRGLPDGLVRPAENALAVRRFDRLAAGRIHQEDFAQVREVSADAKYDRTTYSGVGRVVSTLTSADVSEFTRRMAAMVVMGNTDGHLKNWTLRYPDTRTPRLSPAYDLVSVTAYPEFRNDRLAFRLGGTKDSRQITADHFRRIASEIGQDPAQAVEVALTTAAQLSDTWAQVRDECSVPDFVIEHVEERLMTLPLLQSV